MRKYEWPWAVVVVAAAEFAVSGTVGEVAVATVGESLAVEADIAEVEQ